MSDPQQRDSARHRSGAGSPDLLHWGNHKCIARPRDTVYESMKIDSGSAPIKTDEGWLCIYHAKGDNSRYSLFGILLDLEQPWKLVKRSTMPLFEPELEHETTCLAVSSVEQILCSL